MAAIESLHPELLSLVEALRGAPPLSKVPVALLRQAMREQWFDATAPADVVTREVSIPAQGGALGARLYTPANASSTMPGVVFFHGGGFVFGDLDSHDGACRRLCRASGARILAVDYRLAPEHTIPVAHDDAEAAVRWVFNHAAQLGFDRERIGVAGDSAGALLAAWTAFVLRSDPLCRLKAQTLIYPVLMFSGSTASRRRFVDGPLLDAATIDYFCNSYLGCGGNLRDERLNLLSEDLAGMPPATLVIAGLDPLQDEGRSFGQRMAERGVPTAVIELPDLPHGFLTLSHLSPAVGQIVAQIGTRLGAAL
jgi:acetyl esterase